MADKQEDSFETGFQWIQPAAVTVTKTKNQTALEAGGMLFLTLWEQHQALLWLNYTKRALSHASRELGLFLLKAESSPHALLSDKNLNLFGILI